MTRSDREVDEPTERLIVRWLDGQLSAEQLEQLRSALACSAAARRLLAEYKANDRLAREALRAAVTAPVRIAPAGRSGWFGRVGAWAGGIAAAAAVVVLLAWPLHVGGGAAGQMSDRRPGALRGDVRSDGPVLSGESDYFGLYDAERQELYLLEIPRQVGQVARVWAEL